MGERPIGYFALFFWVILAQSVLATTYNFQVAENGETTVTIKINQTTNLSFPPDITSPQIEGGTLKFFDEHTAIAQTDTNASINYVSSYHTRKEQGVWHFEAKLSADKVNLVLPQAVHVVQSLPRATFTKEDKWKLDWENINDTVEVSYVQVNQAQLSQDIIKPVVIPGKVILILLLALIIGTIYFYTRKEKSPAGKPNINEGQLNIIRAANPNEALVLKTILSHNGYIKRNKLEQESKLSKSSLASVLKNLEHKNIITIDRTFFVHYISITSWFKELK